MSSAYNPIAGPSSHRRQSSRGYDPAYLQAASAGEGRFDDASDDERWTGSTAPSGMPTAHAAHLTPARRAPSPPMPAHAYSTPPRPGHAPTQSPNQDRIASSNSIASMSSALRGRRAPAPAALDLSPRSERTRVETERNGQSSLGLGLPSDVNRNSAQRASRPLPQPPAHAPRAVTDVPPSAYQAMISPRVRQSSLSNLSSYSNSPRLATVPLSAVGSGRQGLVPPGAATSVQQAQQANLNPVDMPTSPASDYYLRSPQVPHAAVGSFSPASPEFLDPSNIDRNTLIGTGELSTPRWTSQLHGRHGRTPSMPHDFGNSPPMPSIAGLPQNPQNWAPSQTGLGLGVGVMRNVQEESPQRPARRMTHQPAPPISSAIHDDLLTLNNLPDFDFDSSMTAALAASLSVPDELPPAPKINREHRASAPPAQSRQLPPSIMAVQDQFDVMNVSPGSARSRIYARRLSRQQATTSAPPVAEPQAPAHPPPRTSSMQSPPTSADPYNRRKTPPTSRDGPVKSRQSPSAPHHDIIKHFAPKDFSHLPPSPSSASINQFLKGSGSINNFAAMGTPPGSSQTVSTSYFSQSGSNKSIHRSNSGKAASVKTGWEGKDVDPDTAEALRKLDGLSSTPGKSRTPKGSKTPSRPATPPPKPKSSAPPSEGKLAGKPSLGSLKLDDSPLNAWIDLADDVPAVPVPPRGRGGKSSQGAELDAPQEKRESSSSTSFVGTPTSRDSQSLPTTSTTPSSSGAKPDRAGRRASAGSETSAHSSNEAVVDGPEAFVPPVPPLPKGYSSMRQGMTYVPLQDAPDAPAEVHSPSSPLSVPSDSGHTSRPRPMNKKWSFSSALNLRLHSKDAPSSPVGSPGLPEEKSPQTPWSELSVPSPGPEAEVKPLDGSRSNQSITPVATSLTAPPLTHNKSSGSGSKRLTPSSIPFFRRTSSSSMTKTSPDLPPQPQTAIPTAPTQRQPAQAAARKSVLGMSIPSMLRGNSKRTVSQQLPTTAENAEPQAAEMRAEQPQFASTGWTGRKRGKTLSISGDLPAKLSAPPLQVLESQTLRTKPSYESSMSQRSSVQSNHSESTVHGHVASSKSGLPAIQGSPALRHPPSTASLRTSESPRELPSATPTKIPRIARPAESPSTASRGSMPPPTMPMQSSRSGSLQYPSRTMSNTASMSGIKEISEFGSMNGVYSTPRQTTSGSHRAHLLAPMSVRTEGRRPEKHREPLVRNVSGQVVPPSRRHLPIAPSSVLAPTASSIAKRSSREFRPAGSRQGSGSGSGQNTPSESSQPIKPSKSLHAKLSIPTTNRLPSSSSVGAPGLRKTSLVPDSPSSSPVEDDEVQADAEMHAYVKRRKARHAAGKKEDLTDINGFPQDVSPSPMQTQRAFITKNLSGMTDYERKEVLDFDEIYFTPTTKITRPVGSGGLLYNHGYDDERGDYLVVEGDHLCYRYEVTGMLGKGSFGQVVRCRDHRTGGSVAVKIIRNKKRFHAQALVEVKILQQLVEWDPEDRHYMVRMTEHFYFRSHLCIVTEMLSINLYELIKANQFAGFSTILIRRFTVQMLASLQLMRSHRIVHCDLKPENILLCHPRKSGIKVIDFGSSCLETEKVYTYIQSRFYRSPEVILGMNYAMAIDMWSLGCILAELYTGVPIFPGENEHEQLACIMEVMGVPDRHVIEKASRRKVFFDATGAPRPFVNAKGKRRRPGTKSLASVLKCNDELFLDFIAKCLTWDPDKRLKPQPALRHPWILAGRRRAAPTAPTSAIRSHKITESASSSNIVGSKDKKGLMISPPTPLMARTTGSSNSSGTMINGSSKIGHSSSSSRILSGAHLRGGSTYA